MSLFFSSIKQPYPVLSVTMSWIAIVVGMSERAPGHNNNTYSDDKTCNHNAKKQNINGNISDMVQVFSHYITQARSSSFLDVC